MGSDSSHITSPKWDFNRFAQATGLSRAEIEQIYLDYMKAAGRDGVMDKEEFVQLYSTLPIAQSEDPKHLKDHAIRIFRAFDLDHNNILTFDEFLNVMVMMNYQMSQTDRINLLVEENNTSGHAHDDNVITMEYGLQIFRRLNDFCGLPPGTEHQSWKQVDQYNRSYVTQEEFADYISRQPVYNR